MNSPAGQDRLYASLNPLVMDGTLTPHQADRVYSAVGAAGAGPAAPATAGASGWDRSRLFAALTVLAAGLLATAYLVATVVNGSSGTQWKSTTLLLGTAAFVGAAAAVWLLLLEGNGWSTWVSGVLGAVALAGLTFSILVLGSDDADALVYVTGLLMLAGGAAGFWFLKGQLYARGGGASEACSCSARSSATPWTAAPTRATRCPSASPSSSTVSWSPRPDGSSPAVGCSA